VFAASFVITVACSKQPETRHEPTHNPPAPMEDAAAPADAAVATVTADAREEGFMATYYVRQIPATKPGEKPTCEATQNVHCTPDATCNPPSPSPVPCPTFAAGETDAYIGKRSNGTCVLTPMGCKEVACAGAVTACPQY
jgi:hypothetical protein